MSGSKKIASCPFCGSENARPFNQLDENGDTSFGIQCADGDCAICGPESGSELGAIESWNKRAFTSGAKVSDTGDQE